MSTQRLAFVVAGLNQINLHNEHHLGLP